VFEMTRLGVVVALSVALLAVLAASPGAAQWVRLQRCNGAIPCAIPFGVRYAPDPLIAAQYGYISPTGISGRIALDGKPVVELDLHYTLPDFAREAAAKSFVLAHTPPPLPPPAAPPKPAD
jgi:hypothetical protein